MVHNDPAKGLSKTGGWGMIAEQVMRAAIPRHHRPPSEMWFLFGDQPNIRGVADVHLSDITAYFPL